MSYDTKKAAHALLDYIEPLVADDFRRRDLRDPRNRPDVIGPVVIDGMTEGRINPLITCCEYHRNGGLWLYCNNER